MKIAKLGLESATVADLRLNAAAKTIVLQYPDPFADDAEEVLTEWDIFVLFLMRHGVYGEAADHSRHWFIGVHAGSSE